MKCRFIDECSSVDFSKVDDVCYSECEQCAHYVKISFLESVLE